MCVMCDQIDFEIRNVHENPHKKYLVALDTLNKAFGYNNDKWKSESSPYKSVNELIDNVQNNVVKKTDKLFKAIVNKYLKLSKSEDDFTIKGNIFINPQTGNPLKKKEWQEIKREVMKLFGYVYSDAEEEIAHTAMELGLILSSIDVQEAIGLRLGVIKKGVYRKEVKTFPVYRSAVMFAEEQAGSDIVNLKEYNYKLIHDTIVRAQKEHKHSKELELDLFRVNGDINRDWQRIARTEIANNVNTAQLVTELAKTPKDEYTFIKGVSSPNACPWCRNEVNGKVFVLLNNPVKGYKDKITINGTEYTAIWPGKSNVGRKRQNWWVSVIQHPHCLCTFSRYEPGFESQWEKLNEAMIESSSMVE